MNAKTYTVPADKLTTFRRSVLRSGSVIVLSSPIGGDQFAVTVRSAAARAKAAA